MKIVPFRIPDQIVLPGLVVKVRLENPNHVNLQGGCGAWEYDEEGMAVITINKRKALKVQRYTLLHELQHVMVDYLDQAVERFPNVVALKRDVKRKR